MSMAKRLYGRFQNSLQSLFRQSSSQKGLMSDLRPEPIRLARMGFFYF
jgi:hypothetical protein